MAEQQWEHQAVRTYRSLKTWEPPSPWAQVIRPDGSIENLDDGGGIGDGVVILNRLGREGWQLTSVEVDQDDYNIFRVFWLRRRIA
jgi:hypothetical protein